MISSAKLIRLAKKWQKLASLRRKRISWPEFTSTTDADTSISLSTTDKGHFVVYSIDKRRFVVPLAYLRNHIVAGLLQAAEEEFGLPGDGPITLPYDGVILAYAFSLIQRGKSKDLQGVLAMFLAGGRCLSCSQLVEEQRSQFQASICSF